MSIVNAIVGANAIPLNYFPSQKLFDVPGTYQWTCPPFVSSVSVVCVGGGGGGSTVGNGGGGGGIGYKSNIPVVPGQPYTVVVGEGGAGGASNLSAVPGNNGGNSYFNSISTVAGLGGTGAGIYSASDISNGAVPAKSGKLFLINLYNNSYDANSNYSATLVSVGNQAATFPGMQNVTTWNNIAVFSGGLSVPKSLNSAGPINTVGKSSVWIYVNKGGTGWGSTPPTGQNLIFQYSLNNSTWVTFSTILPANLASANVWSAFSINLPGAAQAANVWFRIQQQTATTTNTWAVTSLAFLPNSVIPQEGYLTDYTLGAAGGGFVGDGGATGGYGGLNYGVGTIQSAGGGGAADYGTNGGYGAWAGGYYLSATLTSTSGGGGGGGGAQNDLIQNGNFNSVGGGGGGVGLLGVTGGSGAGGNSSYTFAAGGITYGGGGVSNGYGGSNGIGVNGTAGNSDYYFGGAGGLYGGGGGGICGLGQSFFPVITGGKGGSGAVRIIWGINRTFPSSAGYI